MNCIRFWCVRKNDKEGELWFSVSKIGLGIGVEILTEQLQKDGCVFVGMMHEDDGWEYHSFPGKAYKDTLCSGVYKSNFPLVCRMVDYVSEKGREAGKQGCSSYYCVFSVPEGKIIYESERK